MKITREITSVVGTADYDTDANTVTINFTNPRAYGALVVQRVVLGGHSAHLYGVSSDHSTLTVSRELVDSTLLVGLNY